MIEVPPNITSRVSGSCRKSCGKPSSNGPLIVTDSELAIRGALAGVGIAYVLETMVSAHLRAGRLLRVLEEWSPTSPGMHLYYPRHRYASPAVKAFLDFVRSSLRSRRG